MRPIAPPHALLALALGLAAMTVLPAPTHAQGAATSALRGLDSKAPIDVDADRIDVLDQQNQAVFSGNVRVRQASLTLEANRIKIAYTRPAGSSDPTITRLDADGNVRMTTPSERATSRFGIYDVEKRILTLIGAVTLTRGTTKVNGNRLTINLITGQTTLDGSTSSGQPGSRVSGRFAVPEKR